MPRRGVHPRQVGEHGEGRGLHLDTARFRDDFLYDEHDNIMLQEDHRMGLRLRQVLQDGQALDANAHGLLRGGQGGQLLHEAARHDLWPRMRV